MVSTIPRLFSDGRRVPGSFDNFFRMDEELFNLLLSLVEPIIVKERTQMREPIPVATRLAVTLRFLATGHTYSELHYQFRLGEKSTHRNQIIL